MKSANAFRAFVTAILAAWTANSFSQETAATDVRESSVVSAHPPAAADFFLEKVHPLLESKCFGCHGEPKDREADLDMRTRAGLLKGGESGKPALIPSQPDQSPLFQAVLRQGKLKMPPKDRNKLEPEEVEILRRWIVDG